MAHHHTTVDAPVASPRPLHPEEIDPLGASHSGGKDASEEHHTPQERRILRFLSIALVATVIAIPILSVLSYSPVINVFVGLLPLLATLILDMVVIGKHFKPLALWIVLLLAHVLGLAVVFLLNLGLTTPLNVVGAVGVSFQFAILITALAWLMEAKRTQSHTRHQAPVVDFVPEKLPEYVQSIEDKAKGLNFAIGRVYRASNGGSSLMRERLRIPKEWYNEFYSIKVEDMAEQNDRASILVRKIHDRLKLLAQREREVFNESEISRLKNLARNKNGEDAVIDVLKTNDRDPVEHYYVSAIDLCERILQELEK